MKQLADIHFADRLFIAMGTLGFLLVFSTGASAAYRSTQTCGQVCALDGYAAKPGTEGGSDASPPCLCLKPKPPQEVADDEKDEPKQPPPPPGPPPPGGGPPPNGGDDECSKEGSSGDKTGRSCESNKDHANFVGSSGSCSEAPDPSCMANGAQANSRSMNGTAQSSSGQADAVVMQAGAAYNQAVAGSLNEAMGRCEQSCSKEMQCRDKKIQEAQQKKDMAEVQKQQQKKQKAQQAQQECKKNQAQAGQAAQQAMAMLQALAQALQAKEDAKKKKDNNAPKFDEVAPTKSCTLPNGEARDVACLCDPARNALFNVRDPVCAGAIASGNAVLPNDPGNTGTGFSAASSTGLTGDLNSTDGIGGTSSSTTGSTSSSTGSSGFAAAGLGADPRTATAGKSLDSNNKNGVFAPLGEGGGGYGGPRPPSAGGMSSVVSKFMSNKNFKSRGLAGMSVSASDGVTGPSGPSIWEKTSLRYKSEDKNGRWLTGTKADRSGYDLVSPTSQSGNK